MKGTFAPLLAFALTVSGCGAITAAIGPGTPPIDQTQALQAQELRVRETLDAWHAAAAASDEAAYFALMTPDAIFLGTDATERWTRDEFQAYAHRPFSEGHGWNMHAIRRDVVMLSGYVAYFDEDLEAVNLGPARGSGVLLRNAQGQWHIAHYNLAITVPNERFDAVRTLLAAPPSEAP